jgi:hypothetical protein
MRALMKAMVAQGVGIDSIDAVVRVCTPRTCESGAKGQALQGQALQDALASPLSFYNEAYRLHGSLEHYSRRLFAMGVEQDKAGNVVQLIYKLFGGLFSRHDLGGQLGQLQLQGLQEEGQAQGGGGAAAAAGGPSCSVLRQLLQAASACFAEGAPGGVGAAGTAGLRAHTRAQAEQAAAAAIRDCLGRWQDFGAVYSSVRPDFESQATEELLGQLSTSGIKGGNVVTKLKVGWGVGGSRQQAAPACWAWKLS